jgi:hypothetical protein
MRTLLHVLGFELAVQPYKGASIPKEVVQKKQAKVNVNVPKRGKQPVIKKPNEVLAGRALQAKKKK